MKKALIPAAAGLITILSLAACEQPIGGLNARDQGAVTSAEGSASTDTTVKETVIDCSISPRGKSEIALFRKYCLN